MKFFFRQLFFVNRGSRGTLLLAHGGLFLGCFLLSFIFLSVAGGYRFITTHFLGALPRQELKVEIKKADVSLFRVPERGKPQRLSPELLARMAALPGVQEVFPFSFANQPVSVELNFLGNSMESDVVLQGFDPALLQADFKPGELAWNPGEALPIIINSQLLAIYNGGYAKSQNLPEISAQALKVPVIVLTYGKAVDRAPLRMSGRIVGLSPRVGLALAIPQAALNRMHEDLNLPPPPVTEAVLRLASETDAAAVREAIEELGFAISRSHPLERALNQFRTAGLAAALTLTACLCLFAFAYLDQTLNMLFLLKKRDYGACLAMGMSRARLRFLLMAEMILLVGADYGLGLVAGFAAARGFNARYLAGFFEKMAGSTPTIDFPLMAGSLLGLALIALVLLVFLPRLARLTHGHPRD